MTPLELLQKHLTIAAVTPSPEEAAAMYHDDVTMEFPFAPEGHTRLLKGRDAILAYFGRIKTFAENFTLGEPVVNAIADGLVARYPGTSTFKETGLPYSQEYILFMSVRDGRIAKLVEYYDGQRVLRALGELQ
jgi:ketosteroid isomerase-like protein